jgi:hypothetical protein
VEELLTKRARPMSGRPKKLVPLAVRVARSHEAEEVGWTRNRHSQGGLRRMVKKMNPKKLLKKASGKDELLLSKRERRKLETRANNLRYKLRLVRKERDKAELERVVALNELKFVRDTMGVYLNDIDTAGRKYAKTLAEYTTKGAGKVFRKKR